MNLLATATIALLLVPQAQQRGIRADAEDDTPPPSETYGRRHALIVGVDTYRDPGFQPLKHAVTDATDVERALRTGYGFDDIRLLLNEEATKAGIDKALEEWACDERRVGENDLFVIFFAGHGVTRTRGDTQRGYLVPVDATSNDHGGTRTPAWSSLIGMRDLEDISGLIPAKHVLFVLDCCFSGLIGRRSTLPVAPGMNSKARQVITAGTARQQVFDGGGEGHSVFARALLDALGGRADTNGDRVITFGELFDYVAREVALKTSERQTPQQISLLDHEGGNVALFAPGVRPGPRPLDERLAELQRTAEERLDELERLSDVLLVHELIDESDRLWPIQPEAAPRMRAWLVRARRLAERRPAHEESLRRAREEARVALMRDGRQAEGASEIAWDHVDTTLAWRHETLGELLAGLDELGLVTAAVDERLTNAETLRERSIGTHADAWRQAIEAIGSHPAYGGLTLEPQLGLVPLGPDPASGLWEFVHVTTGAIPVRSTPGELVVTEATGVVLVLLPGGELVMGSQSEDPKRPNYFDDPMDIEGPVHRVSLAPFLVSKYEMTQAQWTRVTSSNPSYHLATLPPDPGSKVHYSTLHPLETVSLGDCMTWLPRMGLALPTEAQWEYAARATTSFPWWTGADARTLEGFGNVADATFLAEQHTNPSPTFPFEDDWYRTAPTGSFGANAFGLHDTAGNVLEWVRDGLVFYDDDKAKPRPGDGLRFLARPDWASVTRGGAWDGGPPYARSAYRTNMSYGARSDNVGARPTFPLQ